MQEHTVHGCLAWACRGEMPSSICRSRALPGCWVSHSPLTQRVVPTQAFLLKTASGGRRHSSCTQAWNPPPLQPEEQRGGTQKDPQASGKMRRLRKKMQICLCLLTIFAVITVIAFCLLDIIP